MHGGVTVPAALRDTVASAPALSWEQAGLPAPQICLCESETSVSCAHCQSFKFVFQSQLTFRIMLLPSVRRGGWTFITSPSVPSARRAGPHPAPRGLAQRRGPHSPSCTPQPRSSVRFAVETGLRGHTRLSPAIAPRRGPCTRWPGSSRPGAGGKAHLQSMYMNGVRACVHLKGPSPHWLKTEIFVALVKLPQLVPLDFFTDKCEVPLWTPQSAQRESLGPKW